MLTEQMLIDLLNSGEIIRRGMDNSWVGTIQLALQKFNIYKGKIDDDYGKLTEQAVFEFQFRRCLSVDGVVGPNTQDALLKAFVGYWPCNEAFMHPLFPVLVYGGRHPQCGDIPSTRGKMSTFGGPDDYDDRTEGQAFITTYDSPRELMEKQPKLVEMGIIRTDYENPDEFPIVDGCYGKKRASTSWCLDPKGFFCAMRWRESGGLYNARSPKVLVWGDGFAVVCLRTDFGPRSSTGRVIDISDGADAALPANTDNVVNITWAHPDAPLGPVK